MSKRYFHRSEPFVSHKLSLGFLLFVCLFLFCFLAFVIFLCSYVSLGILFCLSATLCTNVLFVITFECYGYQFKFIIYGTNKCWEEKQS